MRLTPAIVLAALVVMEGSAAQPAADEPSGGRAHDTFFYKHDGLRLQAYLYRPSGPGPFPLVVYNHGSREDRTEQPYPFIGRLLADAGYAVLVPERRGYGKSEGQSYADAIGSSRGTAYVARLQAETGDALAAVDHAMGDPSARLDPRRVAIMGFSAGGVVTVFGAARSDRFAAVVTQAAGARSWGRSPELREALPAAARRVRVPTLCMVAENDTTSESVRRVCEAVKANGVVADLIVYPAFTPSDGPRTSGPGHQLFNRQGVSIWGKDVLAFLAKHVGTDGRSRNPIH